MWELRLLAAVLLCLAVAFMLFSEGMIELRLGPVMKAVLRRWALLVGGELKASGEELWWKVEDTAVMSVELNVRSGAGIAMCFKGKVEHDQGWTYACKGGDVVITYKGDALRWSHEQAEHNALFKQLSYVWPGASFAYHEGRFKGEVLISGKRPKKEVEDEALRHMEQVNALIGALSALFRHPTALVAVVQDERVAAEVRLWCGRRLLALAESPQARHELLVIALEAEAWDAVLLMNQPDALDALTLEQVWRLFHGVEAHRGHVLWKACMARLLAELRLNGFSAQQLALSPEVYGLYLKERLDAGDVDAVRAHLMELAPLATAPQVEMLLGVMRERPDAGWEPVIERFELEPLRGAMPAAALAACLEAGFMKQVQWRVSAPMAARIAAALGYARGDVPTRLSQMLCGYWGEHAWDALLAEVRAPRPAGVGASSSLLSQLLQRVAKERGLELTQGGALMVADAQDAGQLTVVSEASRGALSEV